MNRFHHHLLGLLCITVFLTGCSSDEDVNVDTPTSETQPDTSKPATPPPPPEPTPTEKWEKLAAAIEKQIEEQKLEDAATSIAGFNEIFADDKASDEQTARRDEFKGQIEAIKSELSAELRLQKMDEANQLIKTGKYDAALLALDEVLANSPTDEERVATNDSREQIEKLRKARRSLGASLKLLKLKSRSSVNSAYTQLRREPEAALPLLVEASQSTEDSILVANALTLLTRFKQPDVAIPAILGVLSNAAQKANWNDAVAQIEKVQVPGLGDDLLALIQKSDSADQRVAVLSALALVSDPPQHTFAELAPRLLQDSPDLPQTLSAAENAIRRHNQQDFVALYGVTRTTELQEIVSKLPQRITDLLGRKDDKALHEAAMRFAIVSRQLTVPPIEDVKIVGKVKSYEEGPAENILDGEWKSTDLKTMFYQRLADSPTILLDLGSEKTVAGVRIWNFNQPRYTYRGWKNVEVYVSKTQSSLNPTVVGVVAKAPGVEATVDYSTTIPVGLVKGRYVKLKATSVWYESSYRGLAEVQVLGF